MPVEFKLPDVGEGVTEAELLEWHVGSGDAVREDQVVAEIETDKAVVDVPSPVDGTVRELLAEPGEVVAVGATLITFDVERPSDEETIEMEPEAVDAGAESPDASGNGRRGDRVFAAPSARKLARELGVDIAGIDGSGPGGRVTGSDVRAVAERASGEEKDEYGADAGLKSAVSRMDDAGDANEDGTDGVDSGGVDSGGVTSRSGVDADDSVGSGAGTAGAADVAGETAGRERTLAAPATRKVARELGVDVDDVPAVERRDGEAFVTAAAVREYAECRAADREGERTEAPAPGEVSESSDGTSATARGETREPYRGVRRSIGETMERSKFTAPHATHHDTADVTALVAARDRLRERADERGVRLTYLPFVMKAVVAALTEHPILNTTLDEDREEIVYRHYYDIGIATATDTGLMVPVVRDVGEKGLVQLAAETSDLVSKARDRSITREEMQGGTFTITNFGAVGGEYATPIINPPQTAILGLGAIKERPAVHEGEVVPRDVMTLSLSIDHRVIDGAEAAEFVNTLKQYLEEPLLLLE